MTNDSSKETTEAIAADFASAGDSSISVWLFGVFMGLLGPLGLFIASRAVDPLFYYGGLLLAVLGVGMIFYLIYANVGRGKAPASAAHGRSDNAGKAEEQPMAAE
ncbi:MAG: hypothetical protein ACFB3T_02720 [Geminicoccaceae bacterium]